MDQVKPKILITGGLGFIFSHVTEYFLAKGWDVVVIDNISAGSHPEIITPIEDGSLTIAGKIVKLHNQDVSNAPMMAAIVVAEQPDYIVHAAAYTDVDRSITDSVSVFNNNVQSTQSIFEVARNLPNLKKILYISTDEVYGECQNQKHEEDIIFPRNPYSLSKAVGSLMRLAYDNTYPELKDKTAEIRMCNIFGPRQDDRKIMPAIKRALGGGDPVKLHNGGTGYREWLYVKEIPPIIDLVLEQGNRTYNVTDNAGWTVQELIQLAEKITGKTVPTIPSDRPGMDEKYQMNGSRLKKELGWKPMYSFITAYEAYLNDQAL